MPIHIKNSKVFTTACSPPDTIEATSHTHTHTHTPAHPATRVELDMAAPGKTDPHLPSPKVPGDSSVG